MLDQLQKDKIETQARSIFLQGLLLNPLPPGKIFNFNKEALEYLSKFNQLSLEHNQAKLKLCLNFVCNKTDKTIIGVTSEKELKEIIKYKKQVDENHLNDFFESLQKFPLTFLTQGTGNDCSNNPSTNELLETSR